MDGWLVKDILRLSELEAKAVTAIYGNFDNSVYL